MADFEPSQHQNPPITSHIYRYYCDAGHRTRKSMRAESWYGNRGSVPASPPVADRESGSMSFTATLFDFNGVLVDDEAVHLEAFRGALEPLGITVADADYWDRYIG